jgi:hypothetical protein
MTSRLETGNSRTFFYGVQDIYDELNLSSVGILEQSIGAKNRLGIGLPYRPARAQICKCLGSPGIDSKESILGMTF